MKNGVALAVSLVLGVLGFAAMLLILGRSGDETRGNSGLTRRIVVARLDLPAGTQLSSEALETREVPADLVSSIHIDESRLTTVLGRALHSRLRKGDPILLPAVEFGGTSAPREIETQLTDSDRLAIAIEVEEAESLAGLVRPGQKVEVFGTFETKTDSEKVTYTVRIAEDRTVLAVDVVTHSRYKGDPKTVTKHVVTLAVSSEEALKLAHLQKMGHAHLALRRSHDRGRTTRTFLSPMEFLKGHPSFKGQ